MCADYIRTSVQVTEIESALGNEQHMNGLLGLIEMTTQPSISMQAATQQGNDSSSGGQRTIPDEPSSQGKPRIESFKSSTQTDRVGQQNCLCFSRLGFGGSSQSVWTKASHSITVAHCKEKQNSSF